MHIEHNNVEEFEQNLMLFSNDLQGLISYLNIKDLVEFAHSYDELEFRRGSQQYGRIIARKFQIALSAIENYLPEPQQHYHYKQERQAILQRALLIDCTAERNAYLKRLVNVNSLCTDKWHTITEQYPHHQKARNNLKIISTMCENLTLIVLELLCESWSKGAPSTAKVLNTTVF